MAPKKSPPPTDAMTCPRAILATGVRATVNQITIVATTAVTVSAGQPWANADAAGGAFFAALGEGAGSSATNSGHNHRRMVMVLNQAATIIAVQRKTSMSIAIIKLRRAETL